MVKKVGTISGGEVPNQEEETPTRQITWSKHGGPLKAWEMVKATSNFI